MKECLATHTKAGKKRFTGQMFRVAGSRHMMRHGVQVPPIISMARWETHCVLRYLKDSPLINITKAYRDGGQAIKVGASGEETLAIKKFGQQTLKQLEELTVQVAKQDEELARLGEQHAIFNAAEVRRQR